MKTINYDLAVICKEGNLEDLKQIIEKQKNEYSFYDILIAVTISGHLHIVEYLLTSKNLERKKLNSYKNDVLKAAVFHGHFSIFKFLLDENKLKTVANINSLSNKDFWGAAICEYFDIIEHILKKTQFIPQYNQKNFELCSYEMKNLLTTLLPIKTQLKDLKHVENQNIKMKTIL